MKKIAALMITGLLVLLSFNYATADEKHRSIPPLEPIPTINNYTTNIYSSGASIAMASSQCDMDGGSTALQLCIAWAEVQNDDAWAASVGQAFGNLAIKATVATEKDFKGDDIVGKAIGFMWKVKY